MSVPTATTMRDQIKDANTATQKAWMMLHRAERALASTADMVAAAGSPAEVTMVAGWVAQATADVENARHAFNTAENVESMFIELSSGYYVAL